MIHYCISVPKALHSIQFMESGSEQGDKSRNTICMEEAVTSFSLSLSTLLYYSTLFEACLCAAELYVYVCVLRLLHFYSLRLLVIFKRVSSPLSL